MNECQIYLTTRKNVYVFVKSKDGLKRIPPDDRRRLEPLKLFKTVDLDSLLLLSEESAKVIAQHVTENGYSLYRGGVTTTVREIAS